MWKRNLKTFAKHLVDNKLYTTVTLIGFAISLTFVILLSVYIKNEMAINSTHEKKDRIFRITGESEGGMAPAIGGWLQDEIPEIESFTRIFRNDAIIQNDKGLKLKMEYLMADSTFFNIFSFNLIEGSADAALKTKNSVVLSKNMAIKLFGNESPLGKQIVLNTNIPCIVSGVVDDISKTSHFKAYDAIVNFRCLADLWHSETILTTYNNCSFGLYLLAKPNTNLPAKASQILELFKKDFWIYREGRSKSVILEPITDVYFSSVSGVAGNSNSKNLLLVLSAIVILILVLAIINYMNLTIAQSGMRVKETSIKKLVGSSRKLLIFQQINESVALCFIAFLLAAGLSLLAEPLFNSLLNTEIDLAKDISINMVGLAALAVSFIGIISGLIPALIITKLNPIDVINGGFRRKNKGVYSRILIGFQYIIVIGLLISTFVIAKQTQFLQTQNLGFTGENVVWLESNIANNQKEALKDKFKTIVGVKEVSFVTGCPIDGGNNQSFTYDEKPVSFQEFIVDSAFFRLMKMTVHPTGTAYSMEGIYLNQTAIHLLGLDPLPKSFKVYGRETPVIGVVDDFNYGSLHNKIGPAMIRQLRAESYTWNIIIQFEGSNAFTSFNEVKKVYSEFNGGLPFDSGFFNETISNWYEREKRTSKIVGYFALLTIVIAGMGIFAMSIFYIQQKIKEIGIRKVNGAKVVEIIQMLNRDFVIWVVAAFIIASPLAFFAMNKWLQNFAYKTEISWWVFALAGLIALSIALLTVSWQSWRAANKNPVEALRYE